MSCHPTHVSAEDEADSSKLTLSERAWENFTAVHPLPHPPLHLYACYMSRHLQHYIPYYFDSDSSPESPLLQYQSSSINTGVGISQFDHTDVGTSDIGLKLQISQCLPNCLDVMYIEYQSNTNRKLLFCMIDTFSNACVASYLAVCRCNCSTPKRITIM